MRPAVLLAALVALFAGVLLLLEREALPPLAALQLEHARLAQDALRYDLADLAAPVLTGTPLKVRPPPDASVTLSSIAS